MIYRVLVKRPTRKGSEILVDRVIESSGTKYDVQNVLSKGYFGLIVEAELVENIDVINIEKIEPATASASTKLKKVSTVDITVEYTDLEHELIKEWKNIIESARLIRSKIENSVKGRYEPKFEFLGYCDSINLRLGESVTPKISVRLRNSIEEAVVAIDKNIQLGT